MSLEGKLALVTGASMPKGIGRHTALTLAQRGADVVVTGFRHMEGAVALTEEIKAMGRKAMAVQMDATVAADVAKGFAAIKAELGPVDILVNNAALMGHNISIAKTTVDEWDYEVKLCLNSAFYCIKEAWADMCAKKWGRIVNMTSVAGTGWCGTDELWGGQGRSHCACKIDCPGGCEVQHHGKLRSHRHMCY